MFRKGPYKKFYSDAKQEIPRSTKYRRRAKSEGHEENPVLLKEIETIQDMDV